MNQIVSHIRIKLDMSLFMHHGYANQTYFEIRSPTCKNVTTVQIGLKSVSSVTDLRHVMVVLPTVSLRDYHEIVISDILDKGDNYSQIITSLYFGLYH